MTLTLHMSSQSGTSSQSTTKTYDTRFADHQKGYYDILPSDTDYIMENNGDVTLCSRENIQHRMKQNTRHETRKPIKIGTYDGTTPFETFIAKFNNAANYNGWDDRDCLANIKSCLTGSYGTLRPTNKTR